MTKIKQDKLFPKIQTILRQKLVKRKPFSKKDGFFITRKRRRTVNRNVSAHSATLRVSEAC